jgi:Uma2 family endonuclease
MPAAFRTRRFTADEYHRMGQVGILSEDDRVELIDGEVLAMTPIGPRHAASVDRCTRTFTLAAGDDAIVRVQGPVRLNLYTEPEPDVVLLRPRADFYAEAHPSPADILLVVEVADSSIDYDRSVKQYLYAQSGVREYWLVDLNENVLVRHASPEDGAYRIVERVERDTRVAPVLLPRCVIRASDLFANPTR